MTAGGLLGCARRGRSSFSRFLAQKWIFLSDLLRSISEIKTPSLLSSRNHMSDMLFLFFSPFRVDRELDGFVPNISLLRNGARPAVYITAEFLAGLDASAVGTGELCFSATDAEMNIRILVGGFQAIETTFVNFAFSKPPI